MAGIYIHIPFCKKRCIYCDFFSTTQNEKRLEYVKAVCKEMKQRVPYLSGEPIETIYIGGGTPSQLNHEELALIFHTIFENYEIKTGAEITLEANPDDLDSAYVNMLRTLPINRISMGIQTFQDETLKLLNRRHNAQQAKDAVDNCKKAGFNNISIDLIYGLPNETIESWKNDLAQAIALHPEHISAYHLIYEEGTPLWELRKKHQVDEVNEDLSNLFFDTLIKELKRAGYEHYEISNFCLPGHHSRHNSSYWTEKKYLGLGPSAHSYDGVSRQWNVANLDQYMEGINRGEPLFEIEELDLYTQYNDYVITSMRTCWGMSLDKLKHKYGAKLYDYCIKMVTPHLKQGTVEIEGDILRFTPSGIFISDGIMSDMLWVED